MWRWVLAAGVSLLPQFAAAADIVKAPPPVALHDNWSGIYAGLNFGYGVVNGGWTNLNNTTLFGDAAPGNSFSSRSSGFTGGVHAGVNFQSGAWVYGLEAMLNAADINGKRTSVFGAGDDMFNARIRGLITGTGRIGYAFDRWLPYLKGGITAAYIKMSVDDTGPPTTGAGKDNAWRWGPTVGLGVEYLLAPAWSFALEYDYIRLGTGTYQLGNATGSYLWDVDLRDVHLVMARVNYRLSY